MRKRELAVLVASIWPWHPAFSRPVHCYRETYLQGLLPQTEVSINRRWLEQERMNFEQATRMAIARMLRPAERPLLGVVI